MGEVLQDFQWKGIDKHGKRLKGNIRATGIKTVEAELHSREIEVISITQQPRSKMKFWRKRVKARDIVFFTRYLSTMLSAGMPLLKALDVIGHDPENQAMQSVVIAIRNSISTGKTLGDAFADYPDHFDELYCNLVKAGEKSGTLDIILKRLSTYLEKTELLKSKMKKALIYPIAILSIALVVGLILLIFVMPQFETMFKQYNMKLPMFTQIVLNMSRFVRYYWWLLLAIIIGSIWFIRSVLSKNKQVAQKKDEWILKLPLVGTLIQKAIIARFTSTLAITIDAGLPIIESIASMVNIMGNRVYSKGVEKICADISEGNPLSNSMKASNLFPNLVIQMISVGEASGTIADMLNNIARYYEQEVNSVVDTLSALLEPFILVILGVIIGGFVIAMYLPIFKLGSVF